MDSLDGKISISNKCCSFNSESRKIDLKDHVMLKTSVIAAENADQTRINDNILK